MSAQHRSKGVGVSGGGAGGGCRVRGDALTSFLVKGSAVHSGPTSY